MRTIINTTTPATIHGHTCTVNLAVELWHDGTLALAEHVTINGRKRDHAITDRLFEGDPNASIAAGIAGIMDAAALAYGEAVAHTLGLGVTDWLGLEFAGSVTAPAYALAGF